MPEPEIPRCRRCGAQIRWCNAQPSGNPMPLDYEENPRGNVICRYEKGRLIGIVLTQGKPRPTGVAFMPHFATCNPGGKPKAEKPPKPPPASVQPDLFGGEPG